MPTLEHAISLAAKAHAGQLDKAGEPFILHPLRVMMNVPAGPARQVAVLHDVVEDTTISLDQLLLLGFDGVVVEAVDYLTRRKGEEYFDFVRRSVSHPLARIVKRADIADNSKPERIKFIGAGAESMLDRYRQAMEILEMAEKSDVGLGAADPGE